MLDHRSNMPFFIVTLGKASTKSIIPSTFLGKASTEAGILVNFSGQERQNLEMSCTEIG